MCTTTKNATFLIMKRIIATLTIAATAHFAAKAQMGEQRHDFALGINAGALVNKVGFTPKINQFYCPGPLGGVTMRYTSERYLGMFCAFQAELNFAQLGWKEDIYSIRNEKLPDTYRRNLSYIQLPILANLGFGNAEQGFKGYFVAGPQFGYLVKDTEKRSETWTTNMSGVPDRMNNVTAQYGKEVEINLEYGITAGLGGEFSTPIGHFLLEGRYYMALSNLYGNSKTDPFPKSNNSTILIKTTYLFDVNNLNSRRKNNNKPKDEGGFY